MFTRDVIHVIPNEHVERGYETQYKTRSTSAYSGNLDEKTIILISLLQSSKYVYDLLILASIECYRFRGIYMLHPRIPEGLTMWNPSDIYHDHRWNDIKFRIGGRVTLLMFSYSCC